MTPEEMDYTPITNVDLKKLVVRFLSGGQKVYNDAFPRPKADLYIDCRAIRTPRMFPSGDNVDAQSWIRKHTPVSSYGHILFDALYNIDDRRRDEADIYARPFVVMCECAHGIHRSRGMKWILSQMVQPYVKKVEVV